MAVNFSGKWKLDRVDNIDEWLQVFDVDVERRKAMCAAKPTMEVTQDEDGNCFTVTMLGPKGKMYEETFKVKEPYRTTLPFGVTVIATPDWDGDKLVVTAKSEDGKHDMSMIREIVDGELVATSVADGVTCKRFFKKE